MDEKDLNSEVLNSPLILCNEITSNLETPLILSNDVIANHELPLILSNDVIANQEPPLILHDNFSYDKKIQSKRLLILDLIKKKYLINLQSSLIKSKTHRDKEFLYITNTKKEIYNDVKKKISLIKETIFNQETELEKLYTEKKLLDHNKIQFDIIKNQQKLINSYKQTINNFKLDLTNKEKKLEKNDFLIKKFSLNNAELKNTLNRYIAHNKNLQNNIDQLKKDYSSTSYTSSEINDMVNKIKFYQEENIRLSSEIDNIQKDYELITNNFTEVEREKNNIYKQIQELNSSLIKTNVIGTPFVKENVFDDSINSKVLNDISDQNLKKHEKKSKQNNDLDDQIDNIFN